ncbi:hypothetical protein Tco_1481995 [Tanacetum coccineum]
MSDKGFRFLLAKNCEFLLFGLKVTEGRHNLWMKTYFNSSQVFSKLDEVLPNHILAVPVRVKGKICSIMSFPEIPGVLNKLAISKIFLTCSIASSVFPPEKVFLQGIDVVDRNGCDIFFASKLPFGVSERSELFCVATPSHD